MSLSVLPAIAPPDAPLAPGWWPLPPGWWLLGTVLFMLAAWLMLMLMRRFLSRRGRRDRQPDVRVMALAALDELERRKSAGDRETAYRLNEILRASLLDAQAPQTWRPFTPRDDVGVDEREWTAFWDELEMRYRRTGTADDDRARRQRWLAVARTWLEGLPVRDDMEVRP
jgi:hypothetical protein